MSGRILLLSLLLAGTLHADQSAHVQERAALVSGAVEVLEKLVRLADDHDEPAPDAEMQERIRSLFETTTTLDQLTTVTLLCHVVTSGAAEHQSYDDVFDYAKWYCLERIAQIPGEQAKTTLEHILMPAIGSDGHNGERFRELIAKQKQL